MVGFPAEEMNLVKSLLLDYKGLQKYNLLFVYPFKDSSDFAVLLILKERKKIFLEDSFLIIHVLKNNEKNVITGITNRRQLDIYSFSDGVSSLNNGCLFNRFSWIKDSKNLKIGRRREESVTKLSLVAPPLIGGPPPGVLLAVLGWSGRAATPTLEAFDPDSATWRYLPQEDFLTRAYCGVVTTSCGELLVVGGFDGRRCRRSCARFDGRRWRCAPALRLPRCYVACAALGGAVCALGGNDGRRRFRSCERLLRDAWTPMASMRRRRSDASAAVHAGRLFVSGGFDGERVLSCAEVYCPRADQWSLVEGRMRWPRSGHALVSFRGRLWAIGGYDGRKRLNAVESLEGEEWVSRCPLLHPRSNFGAAVLRDRLFVIGGYNGARTFAEVELLEEGRVWRRARPLNKHRSALGACVFVHAHDGCHEPPVAVRVASP